MKLELVLRLDTGGNVMSQWSSSAAKRFIDNKKAKQTENAKVLHDQEMVELKSPTIWDQLCEEFSRRCTEFNSEPGVGKILSVSRAESSALTISRADTDAKMTVTLLPFHVVAVKGIKEPENFTFKVIAGTSDVALFNSRGELMLPEEISRIGLEMFLTI
jgi:hypothetical protein